MSDIFWKNDLSVLWQNPFDFYPEKTMTSNQQWNSLTRFCLYGSAIIIIFELENTIAILLLIIVLLIYLTLVQILCGSDSTHASLRLIHTKHACTPK